MKMTFGIITGIIGAIGVIASIFSPIFVIAYPLLFALQFLPIPLFIGKDDAER
mgnify:FL=1